MSDHLTRLSLASLDNLSDGEAGKVIDAAIKRAVQDLRANPAIRASRKVTIELSLTASDGGNRWIAKVTAKVVLPAEGTKETVGTFGAKAGSPEALFNTVSAANPDQLTMFGGDDDLDDVRRE